MRVVLDTNVLVSALLSPEGIPADLYDAWTEGRYELLTSREQLTELKATLRKPKLAGYIARAEVGRLVNELKSFAIVIGKKPKVRRSTDPKDDFLLELAEGGEADYLVTGDKAGLLALRHHGQTRIVTATFFREKVLRRRPYRSN